MKISKKWILALALALGGASPVYAFNSEALDEEVVDFRQPLRPALVSQATASNISWSQPQAPAVAQPAVPAASPVQAYSAPCTGDTCCDCDRMQLVAMVEATFFWPQFNRNFLTAGFANTLGTQTFQSNSSLGSADGAFLVGPRVTLGFQGERWGIVGRYWNSNIGANAFAPLQITPAATGVTAFDNFGAYTLDLEAQRRFCWCDWNMYGFGGVRYASLYNNRGLNVNNGFAGDNVNAWAYANQQFNGTGLTGGFMGLRPLFDCSPFKLYFVNRYSVLWGTGKVGAVSHADFTNGIGNGTQTNGAAAGSTNSSLFIGEVQLGIQWDADLRCLPGRAFVRSGFEYQYWDAASMGQAFATSSAGTIGLGTVGATASASADNFLFSLVGFNIGAGIMY